MHAQALIASSVHDRLRPARPQAWPMHFLGGACTCRHMGSARMERDGALRPRLAQTVLCIEQSASWAQTARAPGHYANPTTCAACSVPAHGVPCNGMQKGLAGPRAKHARLLSRQPLFSSMCRRLPGATPLRQPLSHIAGAQVCTRTMASAAYAVLDGQSKSGKEMQSTATFRMLQTFFAARTCGLLPSARAQRGCSRLTQKLLTLPCGIWKQACLQRHTPGVTRQRAGHFQLPGAVLSPCKPLGAQMRIRGLHLIIMCHVHTRCSMTGTALLCWCPGLQRSRSCLRGARIALSPRVSSQGIAPKP